MADLTHFDDQGASRMVDVGGKEVTARLAVAEAFVSLQPETLEKINNRELAKGDVYEVARLAGIMAAKKTADLIPLCHPLGLDSATVDFETTADGQNPNPGDHKNRSPHRRGDGSPYRGQRRRLDNLRYVQSHRSRDVDRPDSGSWKNAAERVERFSGRNRRTVEVFAAPPDPIKAQPA